MTALTPQQIRELANEHLRTSAAIDPGMVTALRTAADQLEAVRKEAEIWADAPVGELVPCLNVGNLFLAILTADTAPQEDRDD